MIKYKFKLTQLLIIVAYLAFLITVSYFLSSSAEKEFQQLDRYTQSQYFLAQVIESKSSETRIIGENKVYSQILSFRLLDFSNSEGEVTETGIDPYWMQTKASVGSLIVVVKNTNNSNYQYLFSFKLHIIIFFVLLFLSVVIVYTKWRGLSSVISMMLSVVVIGFILIPSFLLGYDYRFTLIISALFIMLPAYFLGHGFNQKTTIAFVASLLSLILATVITSLLMVLLNLTGRAGEDALYLNNLAKNIDLRGLLYSSIIISTLGVLDDVTTAQSAIVTEMYRLKNTIPFKQLTRSSLNVGREHVISLVNTIFLVFAGAGMPTLILYFINRVGPWWVFLNSEIILEEIVRILSTSLTLILSVPITTYIAAWVCTRNSNNIFSKASSKISE